MTRLRILIFTATALGAAAGLSPPAAGAAEGRAFWITRWNAGDEARVRSAIQAMSALNANMVFLQVYGDSMALHRSRLVPRSPLVSGGFDPLATAIDEGRRRGIEVHAYMNVCNVWSGGLGSPADPSHIVRAHPEWAVVDSAGRSDIESVGTPDTLIFFCPEWDGFRAHVVAVATEIAASYEVDGIHLDYLRFPGGASRCFCSEHRKNFTARFRRPPASEDADFIEWRYADITGLFGEIHDGVTAARPGIKVSAALITPTGLHFQDARRILEGGKLDIAVPMIYTADLGVFEDRARYFHENSGGRLVLAGIIADGGVVFEEASLARRIGLEGHAFFAWSTLDDAGTSDLAALYPAADEPPGLPWKDGSADAVPPVISGLIVRGVLADEATVVWHTDEASRGRVEYGPGPGLGLAVEAPASSFDHAVRISGLEPATRHYYRVTASDPSGNDTRSGTSSFVTGASGPIEVIVDDGDEGFSRGGSWSSGTSQGGHAGDYIFSSSRPEETAWALHEPFLPRGGLYEVAIWYVAGANRASDARYSVIGAAGSHALTVDQRSGGGAWHSLGTFAFPAGSSGGLRLSNKATGGAVVVADAARFRLLEAEAEFVRGDVSGDARPDISDAVAILGYLFLGSEGPACLDAADTDDDGAVAITDAVYLLAHLFSGGPAPPPPYPAAGADPTPDGLADC